MEEVTRAVKITRELKLDVKPEDVTDYVKAHDKTWMHEILLPIDEQRKWFLEIESTHGEDTEDYWNDNKGFRMLHKINW